MEVLLSKKEPDEYYRPVEKEHGEYQYFKGVIAQKTCVECHRRIVKADANVKEGELMWVVKVNLPLDSTRKDLAKNNAILLATAIGTAFLAMLAAYAIVRYVIVKPVLHLKDVSDQVARGNLELRADIRTGDEFEELSHTFNRMLRHLVTVQDELRAVNTDLDGKVDQLAQVNLRLYEMNKLKDDFLATMSHELRTPLNSILGFSDILARSDNLVEKQKRFVRNIQTSGNALMVMINDLLDLAKIESGRMEIQVVECSLADLVERQIGLLNPLADKRNIDLSYEIDPAIPPLLQDSVKIQQILNNLLSNAIKFTPEGGRVRVRARRIDETMFEFVVEDTGIGIPLNEQATIFEKFRQGHTVPGQSDAMTREYGGTGLGLSIVKELSKLLGGEVSLVSEFGKGSTFSVRLPIRLEEQPSAHGETSPIQCRIEPSDAQTARHGFVSGGARAERRRGPPRLPSERVTIESAAENSARRRASRPSAPSSFDVVKAADGRVQENPARPVRYSSRATYKMSLWPAPRSRTKVLATDCCDCSGAASNSRWPDANGHDRVRRAVNHQNRAGDGRNSIGRRKAIDQQDADRQPPIMMGRHVDQAGKRRSQNQTARRSARRHKLRRPDASPRRLPAIRPAKRRRAGFSPRLPVTVCQTARASSANFSSDGLPGLSP